MLSTLYFDFGGCIDAPGIHTRSLFWDAFLAEGHQGERSVFQEAYTRADQRMMGSGEAKTMGLAEFNAHNAALIASDLGVSPAGSGDRVTALMRGYIEHSRSALVGLKGYELGVISNFTGNLEVILREFALRDLFATVTESFYAGCSKPDPRIFQVALGKRDPRTCLYIGDNPKNDITPAKALGMTTVLIHPRGKREECGATFYVEDLRDLSSKIQNV
jgi:FMN phosphatase YigB (HAD superfamily)